MDSRVIPSTEDIEMTVFLTVVAENIHAVSHMKHETFSMYEYAMDFGKIFKEATKRSAKCGHHYFTHPTFYYPLPKWQDILPARSNLSQELCEDENETEINLSESQETTEETQD